MTERWKWIKGYEGLYKISDFGQVRSFIYNKGKGRPRKISKNKQGYFSIALDLKQKSKQFRVSRLVAQHFIPNPMNKPEVNHIDGIKAHNYVANLEWVTPKENGRHASLTGLLPDTHGEGNSHHKLTLKEVRKIRELYKTKKYSKSEIGIIFNVHNTTIGHILLKRNWAHLI